MCFYSDRRLRVDRPHLKCSAHMTRVATAASAGWGTRKALGQDRDTQIKPAAGLKFQLTCRVP